jgi:hypothetical protein
MTETSYSKDSVWDKNKPCLLISRYLNEKERAIYTSCVGLTARESNVSIDMSKCNRFIIIPRDNLEIVSILDSLTRLVAEQFISLEIENIPGLYGAVAIKTKVLYCLNKRALLLKKNEMPSSSAYFNAMRESIETMPF